jgi:predicted DNA-binding transcriptional regulator YafY
VSNKFTSPNARPLLIRIQHIAAALTIRKRTTGALLADELEVSYKTVNRDIEFMRNSLSLPIESDHEGYFFNGEVKLCRCCCRRVRH